MKPLRISEPASLELAEAVRWYEGRRPGWGARLFDAVSHAFELIERHPEIPKVLASRIVQRPEGCDFAGDDPTYVVSTYAH